MIHIFDMDGDGGLHADLSHTDPNLNHFSDFSIFHPGGSLLGNPLYSGDDFHNLHVLDPFHTTHMSFAPESLLHEDGLMQVPSYSHAFDPHGHGLDPLMHHLKVQPEDLPSGTVIHDIHFKPHATSHTPGGKLLGELTEALHGLHEAHMVDEMARQAERERPGPRPVLQEAANRADRILAREGWKGKKGLIIGGAAVTIGAVTYGVHRMRQNAGRQEQAWAERLDSEQAGGRSPGIQ